MPTTTKDEAARTPGQVARDSFPERRGDWMQTYSGRRFWPLDPRAEDVAIEDIAHALSLQTRFGGHCLRFYSVAEHCVHLARSASPEAALWLLLHDGSEAYLSDLVRPLKRHMPEYRAAEDRVAWAVYEAFDLDPGMEPAEVKERDCRILIDERAQVMLATGETWNYGGATEPLGVTLQFWTPEQAEREFLATYLAITGQSVAMPPTPVPASPGVPDGLRALSEAYRGCEAICAQMDADLPDSAEVYVVGARRSRYSLCTYGDIRRAVEGTTHPAGQSAGSGAETIRIARDLVAAGNAADAAREAHEKVEDRYVVGRSDPEERELWKRKTDTLKAYDQKVDAALNHLRSLVSSAPDSTRTGDEGTEEPEGFREALETADLVLGACGDLFSEIQDDYTDPRSECRKGKSLISDMRHVIQKSLAARPAAPEAQGAWLPISTAPKDGTEIWAWLSDSGVRKVRWWSAEELCEEEGRYTPDFYQAGFYEVADKTEWWNPAWWAPADRLPAPPASSNQGGR